MRGCNAQRVDDAGRRKALGHCDSAVGRDRVAHITAEHDLTVARRYPDGAAADALLDLVLQIPRVDLDRDVKHAHEPLSLIVDRQIGSPDLLSLDIKLAVRHRQNIGDIWRPDHRCRKRPLEMKRPRFVQGHDDVPDRFALAARGAGRRRVRSVHLKRESQPEHEGKSGRCCAAPDGAASLTRSMTSGEVFAPFHSPLHCPFLPAWRPSFSCSTSINCAGRQLWFSTRRPSS